MFVCNPFKRGCYTFRTIMSPEQYNRRILDAMNGYNTPGRGRYVMASALGDRFTAKVEPGSLGSRGSGAFLKHFVVEAVGEYAPARDGTVLVTIGLNRATSTTQVVLRLALIAWIALSVWTLANSPIIPVYGVAAGIGIVPFILLWSLVALVHGLRQAGRDWTALLSVIESALASHSVERA